MQLSYNRIIIYFTLFSLYLGLAFLFSTFSPQAQIVSMWPPAGIALTGVIIFAKRFLPAIFIASVTFNYSTLFLQHDHWSNNTFALSTVIALGSTLQAWVNYKILYRRCKNLFNALSYSNIASFILIAFLCCFISAVIGNTAINFSETQQITSQWSNILIWWIGDFLGVILVTPILISLLNLLNLPSIQTANINQSTLLKGLTAPLLLIILIFQITQQYIEQTVVAKTLNEFELKAKVAENSLKQYMATYLNILDQLGTATSQYPSINKQQFSDITKRLMLKRPGLKALSWNPLIQQQDLDAYKIYAKTHIDPQFRIKGQPIIATDPLVIVQFIEPLAENRAAQGFNVFSNSDRKASMLHSKTRRVTTATNILQLVQSDKKEPGFLIFKPVFKNINFNNTSMSSIESLDGFVVGVFLVSEIVEQSLSDDLINFIDIYIYENGQKNDSVYGNSKILLALDKNEGFSHVFKLKFAEHLWTFNLHIDRQTVMSLQTKDSLNFLLAQVLFGTLAVFIILSAFGRHKQLHRLVYERTKALEKVNMRLEHYAFYDALTELPNRRLFFDRVEHALDQAKRHNYKLGLFYLDLNRFKQVNDHFGHQFGDLLLIAVTERFNNTLRKCDTLSRVGGDEFTLLMENNPSDEDIKKVAEKLKQALLKPICIEGQYIEVSSSIGIATYPHHGSSVTQLLKNADNAMYRAKNGEENPCFYSG